MTKVIFFADKTGLYGFEISGHSTDSCEDEQGKLVCSAVSSVAYMAVNTISEIIGDKVNAEVFDGFMRIKVEDVSESSKLVLEGLRLHISELSKQYDSRITTTTEV